MQTITLGVLLSSPLLWESWALVLFTQWFPSISWKSFWLNQSNLCPGHGGLIFVLCTFPYISSHMMMAAESHDMAAVFSKGSNYESPMFLVTWFVSKFNLMICQSLHQDPANTKRWINVGLMLTLNQHWFNVSWLLGTYHRPFKYRVLSSPFWIVLYFKAGITDAISILFWQLGIPILLLIKLLILIINFLLEDSNK